MPYTEKVAPMNIPNTVTLSRIVLIPFLVFFFYLPGNWTHYVCAIIFALAAITDWVDGYLARRLAQSSKFGAFIDPVADKLIVAVALVMLVGAHASAWLAIPAAVIVGREIVISALREWMAEFGSRAKVNVNWIGKVKTVVQMVAIIGLLMVSPKDRNIIYYAGFIALYVAAALTLWSMFVYLKAALNSLKNIYP